MRFRTLLLGAPLIAVLSLGCSGGTGDAPDPAEAGGSDSTATPTSKGVAKVSKKKPKVIQQNTGPTGVAN
jgi:hypothetical protein